MNNSFVGKFVFHCGNEYSQWGEIVEFLEPGILLIKIDRSDELKAENLPPALMAFDVADMLTEINGDGSFDGQWEFFLTREDLDAYTTWLFKSDPENKPKPTVVKFDKLN
jgi:hypothetical protein